MPRNELFYSEKQRIHRAICKTAFTSTATPAAIMIARMRLTKHTVGSGNPSSSQRKGEGFV